MQLAYADRAAYLGDGDFVDVPVEGLLDKAYLAERRHLISPYRAADRYEPGTPPGAKPRAAAPAIPEQGTTHFVTVDAAGRSEEHTSELQSLMRISYAVFCLKKKTTQTSSKETQTNT